MPFILAPLLHFRGLCLHVEVQESLFLVSSLLEHKSQKVLLTMRHYLFANIILHVCHLGSSPSFLGLDA